MPHSTHPIDGIRFVHKALRRHAEVVEILCAEDPDFETAREISERAITLARRVLAHTRGEEEALFPVLERKVPGVADVYRADHRAEERIVARLEQARVALQAAPSTARDEAVEALRREVSSLSEHLHDHVRLEHRQLIPLVERHIAPDEQRRILAEMTRVLAEGDGPALDRWIRETLDEDERAAYDASAARP